MDTSVAHAARTFGSLDVLVNCAAHCSPVLPLFMSQPDESWARNLDVTRTGALRCCRTVLPHLRRSRRRRRRCSRRESRRRPRAAVRRTRRRLTLPGAGSRRRPAGSLPVRPAVWMLRAP
ncbi:SDR family oxidoreductase [Streptomyces longwoodensis]|uniref:SDR family oxidoreductase n=1 Tax=Streptomyces longwoodensis TaxID=68231 RepID=UPI003F56C0B7